MKKKVTPQ